MAVRIADLYAQHEAECIQRFEKLRANEEALNRAFLRIYGMEGTLDPAVADKAVSVSRPTPAQEARSLLSYTVGCIFGRYSVDVPGLCYAGGTWEPSKYRTILPVPDNIVPVDPKNCGAQDLTARITDFVRRVYGEETLEENLRFLAQALGGTAEPSAVLRHYLSSSFYADHCKSYKKRPIYWLFRSGSRHAFQALVYLHRWTDTLTDTMRTAYVLPLAEQTQDAELRGELLAYADLLHQYSGQSPVPDGGVEAGYAQFAALLAPLRSASSAADSG